MAAIVRLAALKLVALAIVCHLASCTTGKLVVESYELKRKTADQLVPELLIHFDCDGPVPSSWRVIAVIGRRDSALFQCITGKVLPDHADATRGRAVFRLDVQSREDTSRALVGHLWLRIVETGQFWCRNLFAGELDASAAVKAVVKGRSAIPDPVR